MIKKNESLNLHKNIPRIVVFDITGIKYQPAFDSLHVHLTCTDLDGIS